MSAFLFDLSRFFKCSAFTFRTQKTFNNPPPKKKSIFFGGGVRFWEFFYEFMVLEQNNFFGKTLEQAECFGWQIGRFSPILVLH